MHRSAKGLLTVESNVPYGASIAGWLALHDRPFSDLEHPSRWYERAFLAWETVRRVRNPFFSEGTGFEGYYIGQCHSADEMTARLLELGHAMIASNDRLYPYDYAFKTRLMNALSSESVDVPALKVWAELLGAMLGRLRRIAGQTPAAGVFQTETYRMTNSVPPIRYSLTRQNVQQTYTLPFPPQANGRKLAIDFSTLAPTDRDAAMVVWSVGRLGHPLVRQYLAEVSRTPW
jgi:hypothetical protein